MILIGQAKGEALVEGDLLALELRKRRAADAARRQETAAVAGSTDLLQASISERRSQVQVRQPQPPPWAAPPAAAGPGPLVHVS